MFLYNCYGLPTGSNMKAFCREFLYKILNKNSFGIKLTNKEHFNKLWELIKEDTKSRRSEIPFERNGGYTFYETLQNNLASIRNELKQYKDEESQMDRLAELLNKLEYRRRVESKDYIKVVETWRNSTMNKDGARLVGIPTGNDKEQLWYAFYEDTKELKIVQDVENLPRPLGKTWDNLVQEQKEDIITHLNGKETNLLECNNTELEELKGFEFKGVHSNKEVETPRIQETIKVDNTKAKDKVINASKELPKSDNNTFVSSLLSGFKPKEEENLPEITKVEIPKLTEKTEEKTVKLGGTFTPPKTVVKEPDYILIGDNELKPSVKLSDFYKLKSDENGRYIEAVLKKLPATSKGINLKIKIYENGLAIIPKGEIVAEVTENNIVMETRTKKHINIKRHPLENNIAAKSIHMLITRIPWKNREVGCRDIILPCGNNANILYGNEATGNNGYMYVITKLKEQKINLEGLKTVRVNTSNGYIIACYIDNEWDIVFENHTEWFNKKKTIKNIDTICKTIEFSDSAELLLNIVELNGTSVMDYSGYRLKDESMGVIGKTFKFNGENVKIISVTEVEYKGNNININDFISKYSLDLDKVRIGVKPLKYVYTVK